MPGTRATSCIAAAMLLASLAWGREIDELDSSSPTESVETYDTSRPWVAMPVFSTSPETGLVFGGRLIGFIPSLKRGDVASTIDFSTWVTTEEQKAFVVSPNLYLANGRFNLKGNIYANLWTANFYGIGNDSTDDSEQYKANDYRCSAVVEYTLQSSWVLGLAFNYHAEEMMSEQGGTLQASGLPGSTGGNYAGLGMTLGLDTRDNINAAHTGGLVKYRGLVYDSDFGSDYGFRIQELSLRGYLPVTDETTLALAATARMSRGDVPFRYLSSPDGGFILRGIENRRFIDHDMLAMQSEFRFPVAGRFTGAAFAEVAQVAPRLEEIDGDDYKVSFGLGLRYQLRPAQRLSMRADIGWVDGQPGIVAYFREAF